MPDSGFVTSKEFVGLKDDIKEIKTELKNMAKVMTTIALQEQRLNRFDNDLRELKEGHETLKDEFHSTRERCITERAKQVQPDDWFARLVSGAVSHGLWIVISVGAGAIIAKCIR